MSENKESKFKFTKSVQEQFRGRQKSQWDDLLPEFDKPGMVLHFDNLSKTQAAQAAARLNLIDPDNKYHSGYDALEKKPFIRRRMPDEVEEKEDNGEQEPKKGSLLDRLNND